MASSYFQFRGKGFWMHHAPGTVWLAAVVQASQLGASLSPPLGELIEEIAKALSCNWVDGIFISAFDEYISDEERLREFANLLKAANLSLEQSTLSRELIQIGEFSSGTDYLLPEMRMAANLFIAPELVPEPPHIFKPAEGWAIA